MRGASVDFNVHRWSIRALDIHCVHKTNKTKQLVEFRRNVKTRASRSAITEGAKSEKRILTGEPEGVQRKMLGFLEAKRQLDKNIKACFYDRKKKCSAKSRYRLQSLCKFFPLCSESQNLRASDDDVKRNLFTVQQNGIEIA